MDTTMGGTAVAIHGSMIKDAVMRGTSVVMRMGANAVMATGIAG